MFRQKMLSEPELAQLKISSNLMDSFKVFAFQPDEEFYFYSFDKRLQILEDRVRLAKKTLNEMVKKDSESEITNIHEDNEKSRLLWAKNKIERFKTRFSDGKKAKQQEAFNPPPGLLVAPEYLFKDFSELSYKRYYTQQQKNVFKAKLKELSSDTDMLIVPGTICWHKKAKRDQSTYYRNTAYFFYRGNIQKYKKSYPHTNYDFDYTDEGFLNFMDFRRTYFKSEGHDALVKNYCGIKIGIEICFDSVQGALSNFIKESNAPLDMQLIIADGAKKPTLIERNGLLFIKLERNACETEIGTIMLSDVDKKIQLKPAISLGCVEGNDLTCFQFK